MSHLLTIYLEEEDNEDDEEEGVEAKFFIGEATPAFTSSSPMSVLDNSS